jgi:hypothetical protein
MSFHQFVALFGLISVPWYNSPKHYFIIILSTQCEDIMENEFDELLNNGEHKKNPFRGLIYF